MGEKWLELIVQARADLAEEASARMLEAGASAVERRDGAEEASLLVTHLPLEKGATANLRAMEALLAALGVGKSAMTIRRIEDQDWIARSRDHFQGAACGERLWIRPPWDERETPTGRVELLLEPGLAFGTGRHPSTRLALLAIESRCARNPPERMVDAGCGSGILSVAALLFGAKRALALDLDPRAVEETRALAKNNGVANRITARNATLDSRALKDWRGRVDFIAANLFLDALSELAPRIREALAPGGRGALSGIGCEQADALARACREARLEVRGTNRLEEWASLEIAKP